jgi:hypothetical protein
MKSWKSSRSVRRSFRIKRPGNIRYNTRLYPRDSFRHGFTPYYGVLGPRFTCHHLQHAADANSTTVKRLSLQLLNMQTESVDLQE